VSEFVAVHVRDGIGTLLLSRPPGNALTRQVNREVASAATELERRTDLTAVIVYGGHEIFCAGDDTAERATLSAAESARADDVARAAVEAVAAIAVPTVAAITGYALGSGLHLALTTDWRVTGDNAKFGVTEVRDGLAIPRGAAWRLTRAVGESRAKRLAFGGRFVAAPDALAMGLVDELSAPDHVYDAALAWVATVSDVPRAALVTAKAAFISGPSGG
jgi:enoyl-CoA hydratase